MLARYQYNIYVSKTSPYVSIKLFFYVAGNDALYFYNIKSTKRILVFCIDVWRRKTLSFSSRVTIPCVICRSMIFPGLIWIDLFFLFHTLFLTGNNICFNRRYRGVVDRICALRLHKRKVDQKKFLQMQKIYMIYLVWVLFFNVSKKITKRYE